MHTNLENLIASPGPQKIDSEVGQWSPLFRGWVVFYDLGQGRGTKLGGIKIDLIFWAAGTRSLRRQCLQRGALICGNAGGANDEGSLVFVLVFELFLFLMLGV